MSVVHKCSYGEVGPSLSVYIESKGFNSCPFYSNTNTFSTPFRMDFHQTAQLNILNYKDFSIFFAAVFSNCTDFFFSKHSPLCFAYLPFWQI